MPRKNGKPTKAEKASKKNRKIYTDMLGKKFSQILIEERLNPDDVLTFITEDGERFIFYHEQECCEDVHITDICGDINDLLDSPLLEAREETQRVEQYNREKDCSETWTFYKFATIKGCVTIRWYGSSNGCYSESVDFKHYTKQAYEKRESDYAKYGEYDDE